MNWVIGDIHGMSRPLRCLVEHVLRLDAAATFNFVGDYVNRGPDSKGVIDFLLQIENSRFCRGNHDDIFDQLLHGAGYVQNPSATSEIVAFRWFIQHGLGETLQSYGVSMDDIDDVFVHPTPESVNALFQAVPETHRSFVRNLVPIIEMPDFFVAHAMWDIDEPDEPLMREKLDADPRRRYQIIWGRYGRELTRPKRWRRTGYFGHTPVQTYPADLQGVENTPIRGPQIVLTDTAVALTPEGRLSAVCVESGQTVQVDRLGGVL